MEELSFVAQAVVLAKEDAHGEKQLVAYIVPLNSLNTEEIQRRLLQKLPSYMVPSVYIPLESIPLTDNGKINRKALLSIKYQIGNDAEVVAPRNDIEIKIAEIWKAHFELENLGVTQGYFQLGGDSIKIIRLLGKLNQTFDVHLSLAQLYQHPTIEQQALLVTQGIEEEQISTSLLQEIEGEIDRLKKHVLKEHPRSQEIADVYVMSDIQIGMVLTSQVLRKEGQYGV